jgi:hypothetical protein
MTGTEVFGIHRVAGQRAACPGVLWQARGGGQRIDRVRGGISMPSCALF